MKPAPFDYVAPDDTDGILDALHDHGDDAKVLAGGQSLGPLLNLRLATPAVIVDINRAGDVPRGVVRTPSGLRIGAMTRQSEAIRSPLLNDGLRLVGEALEYVAHPTIRNRGTIGGSLAHADPAAEMPAVSVALDARFELVSREGTRTLPAQEFFQGHFTTALEPTELLMAIDIAIPESAGFGCAWSEFAPRSGDFALAGAAVTVHVDPDLVIREARIACSGISDVPVFMTDASSLLVGRRATAEAWEEVGRAAAAQVNAAGDLLATQQYRRQLTAVVVAQAAKAACAHGRAAW